MTERLGGLVMWSRERRAFLAFGWSDEPLVGVDRAEIEHEIGEANKARWPGGQ